MRSTIAVAAFALAGMTVAAVPAEAAWKCHGAEYVCGKSHQKTTYRKSSYRSYHRSSKSRYAYRNSHKHYAQHSSRTRHYAQHTSRKRHYASRGGSAGGGMASYYWQGQRTASGVRFNPDGLTAAHRTLPFGTRVRVTNQSNGQSVVVTINDRGPFVGGRVIDLSRGAARAINMTGAGVARVSLQVLN